MGACASKRSVIIIPKHRSDLLDLDSRSISGHIYSFTSKLSGFRLLSSDLENCSLRISSSTSSSESGLGTKESSQIIWDSEWEFSHSLTFEKLQKEQLTIELLSDSKRKASLKLNLYQVARGPSAYSISLFKTNQLKGRLSFKIEMLQQTNVEVFCQKVKCMLEYPLPSEFSLTLKLNSNHNLLGKHSEISPSPRWDFSTSENAPRLIFPATINDIRTAIINIKLWILHGNTWKLRGQCWMTFPNLLNKSLYQNESEYFTNRRVPKLARQHQALAHFSQDLVNKGKKLGTIKGSLLISGLPFIHQMITGVNTEEKIELQDIPVLDNTKPFTRKLSISDEVNELTVFTSKLKNYVDSVAAEAPYTPERDDLQIKTIEELSELLCKTHVPHMISFTYDDINKLLASQKVLLKLAEHLCKYCDSIGYSLRPYYCDCLGKLIIRGEVDLGSLRLNVKDKHLYDAKLEIAYRYRRLLQHLLKFALPKLNLKGADSKVYQFVELFLVIAYFRVPGFSEKLLESLQKKMWEPLAEFTSIEMKEENQNKTAENTPVLNWNDIFYMHLPNAFEDRQMQKLINDSKWRNVMAKRSTAYFKFVGEWAMHVNRQFVRHNIPWTEIPGYTLIVKSFLLELKNRNILSYPEALIKTSCRLLLNSELFKPFIEITFRKANVYRYKTVVEALNVLSHWLEALWTYEKKIPYKLDDNFLIKGLKIAICDDIAMTVAKALSLIYRHYHIFTGNIRVIIVKECLLTENFERLMYHWSKQVRAIYMHILLYRVVSLKDFSFEKEPFSSTDQQIYEIAQSKLTTLPHDINTPYFKLALEEYRKLHEQYHHWFYGKVMAASNYNGIFGPFDLFPYPDVYIEERTDRSERKIDELTELAYTSS